MKNTLLIAALAGLAICISSCRKERTCECKTTTTRVVQGPGPGTGTYIDNTSSKITKDKQKSKDFRLTTRCISESYTEYDSNGPQSITRTVDTKCELN